MPPWGRQGRKGARGSEPGAIGGVHGECRVPASRASGRAVMVRTSEPGPHGVRFDTDHVRGNDFHE